MIYLHLRNRNKFISILAYNPKSGNYIEFIDKSSKDSNVWRGSYTKSFDNKVARLYATPNGPVFFLEEERFLLTPKAFRAIIEDEKNSDVLHFSMRKMLW